MNPNKSNTLINIFSELINVNKEIESHYKEIYSKLDLENISHLKLNSTAQNKLSFKIPFIFLSRLNDDMQIAEKKQTGIKFTT